MRVLVTGGAGFIGSNLANELAENSDNQVIALDDLSLGIASNLSNRVQFVRGSIKDPELLLRLTRGVDYVFHDAAKSSSPMFKDSPSHGVDVNAIGFMNVMECSRKNSVKKVIFASSSSLYNGQPMPFKESQILSPRSFYEASFYCREVLARSYYLEWGMKSVGLRYFSVYGPNERHKGKFANNITQFLWDVSSGTRPVVYGDGSQTRDFTFVTDVVSANILAMESDIEFGLYNVGTGRQASFNEVIEMINEQLGTAIPPNYVENVVKNYVQDTLADTSMAKHELKFEARYDLAQGIARQIENLRKEGSKNNLQDKSVAVARTSRKAP
ncbi:MAG: NAD-dependent epimerase/dehydratase family protein [Nitrososphaera sp.]|nr:NAD-dependent epimerase/dehydratase family protein [Nitrososphaera sp.]